MNRKLIIDGNAVYEIDEGCMLKERLDRQEDSGSSAQVKEDEEGKKTIRRK